MRPHIETNRARQSSTVCSILHIESAEVSDFELRPGFKEGKVERVKDSEIERGGSSSSAFQASEKRCCCFWSSPDLWNQIKIMGLDENGISGLLERPNNAEEARFSSGL